MKVGNEEMEIYRYTFVCAPLNQASALEVPSNILEQTWEHKHVYLGWHGAWLFDPFNHVKTIGSSRVGLEGTQKWK